MLVSRRQMSDRIAVERGFAADMLGGDELVALLGEFGAVDAEHHRAVAFEKAAPAIIGKARMAGHADETVNSRQRTADIEHRVEHSRHRACRAGAHRHQKRPPPVAEALAGGLLEKLDPLGEDAARSCAAFGLPLTVAAQRLIGNTKAGGTGRPRAAMRARLAALPPTISAEYCSVNPPPMRAICTVTRVLFVCA